MNLDLAIAAFVLMLLGNYWVARSVLYPPFIFCLMFLLDLSIFSFHPLKVDALHPRTLTLICVGAAAFSIAGALAAVIPSGFFAVRLKLAPRPKGKRAYKVFILLVLLCCVPHVIEVNRQLAAMGTGNTFFEKVRDAAIRNAISGETKPDWIISFFVVWSLYLPMLFMIDRRDWMFWIATLFGLLASTIDGGRTGLLTLISALTAIYIIQTKRQHFLAALKTVRLPLLAFLSLYVGLIFVSKDTSGYGSVGETVEYFIISYIIGPTAALDRVVQHPSDFASISNHSFQFFFKGASTLHLLGYVPPERFDQFILVPFPANVYTIYKFNFLENGMLGAILLLGTFGFLHSMLYRKAWFSDLGLFLFSVSIYSVIMVIFDDAYFLGGYLRAASICLIFLWMRGLDIRLLPVITKDRRPLLFPSPQDHAAAVAEK